MIKKGKKGVVLYSKSGKKLGTFPNEELAKKRERQIRFFVWLKGKKTKSKQAPSFQGGVPSTKKRKTKRCD